MNTNYREGESVNIHGCNYVIKEDYLSAKSNGSYPKVLAKILGIANIDQFVMDTLGYCNYNEKKFGFASIEDANKLIDALVNFKGVSIEKSYALKNAAVKKFFDNDSNLENLSMLSSSIEDLMKNFATIRSIATNVLNKITKKNNEFVLAIDNKELDSIKRISKELQAISEYTTDTDNVLAILNKMGKDSTEEEVEFSAEDFINGDK